jgi:solute carrier family 25, member 39/40
MGGAAISAIIVTPLDVVKTRIQTQTFTDSPEGVLRTFRNIARYEGFTALWKGLGLSTLSAVPTVGVYLMAYDLVKERLERSTDQHAFSQQTVPLVAGTLARTIAVCLSAPIENARTMAQARAGAWQQLQGSIKQQGYRSLWRGFWPYLARDVPFSAIYWSFLEGIRAKMLGAMQDREVQAVEVAGLQAEMPVHQLLQLNFCAGITAGMLASAVTTPVDVVYVKTVTSVRRRTPTAVARQLWATEGLAGFFKGMSLRVSRVAPSCAMVIMSFELLKKAVQ